MIIQLQRRHQSYLLVLLVALGVLIAQMITFAAIWSALLSDAAEQGRTQRGSVAIGITIHYGFYLFMPLAYLASLFGACIRRAVVRWVSILVFLGVWLGWLYPGFSQYPVRLSAFAAAGSLVCFLGSGLLMPPIGRRLRIRLGNQPAQIDQ